jgi:hypothetical protein
MSLIVDYGFALLVLLSAWDSREEFFLLACRDRPNRSLSSPFVPRLVAAGVRFGIYRETGNNCGERPEQVAIGTR